MKRRLIPLAVLSMLLLPNAAGADGTRLSLEAQKEATCAAFDQIGSSYRPYTCDPRCDCLSGAAIAEVDDCSETAPGTYTAVLDDAGSCNDSCLPLVPGGLSSYCSSSSNDPCTGTCTDPEETCVSLFCLKECGTSNDCTGPPVDYTCDNSPIISCTSDADCIAGVTCFPFANVCGRVLCTQDTDCLFRFRELTLAGISGLDTTDPVICSDGDLGQPPSTSTVNSNDALECVAQIETAIGQACTPFSP